MKIYDVIWLAEVEEKIIVKHSVWPEEAEEVLENRPTCDSWNADREQAKICMLLSDKRKAEGIWPSTLS